MVSKELISKTIDYSINKCKNGSYKARKRGDNVSVSTQEHEDGSTTKILDYGDGIKVSIDKNKPLSIIMNKGTEMEMTMNTEVDMFGKVTYNDKEYELTFGDSDMDKSTDKFFEYQKNMIIEKYGNEGWDFFTKYSNEFGSYQGWNMNMLLRGEKTKEDLTDKDGDFYISPFLLENHDRFVEMEKSLPLDREGFADVRIVNKLHRNDSISKKVVSDNGHTSTSTLGEFEHYETYGDYYNGWFILTVNETGSGVKGAYLGNAIKEEDGYDWEREVNYVPNQEFERLVIDEKNRIIVQKPLPTR